MNRKFFQLRQMTKNLDEDYEKEAQDYYSIMNKQYIPNYSKLEYDRRILREWDLYKRTRLSGIIDLTLDSDCFKICLCEFTKMKKKVSLEFWIKVAYDVFHEYQKGALVRLTFWKSMKKKSRHLEYHLKQKRWPDSWKYLAKEPCLNLEVIKLYEQYIPIRPFIAEKLNTKTKIMCDVRRMPMLREDKQVEIDLSRNTWFPPISMGGPSVLEQLSNSDNYFCHQLTRFIIQMKPIISPILDFFRLGKNKGRIINLYGQQFEFLQEVLYSLKACCGQTINSTSGSMKIKKNYKNPNSYRFNETACSIILTTLSQTEITAEVLNDISSNISSGYSAFVQQEQSNYTNQNNKRLVFMFSEQKLLFKFIQKGITYYQIPDEAISNLINTLDYPFLTYYANIMFNKCMIVQQNCSSRKPYYQIMICMWTYVLVMYFQDDIPNLASHKIYRQISKLAEEIQIDLGLSSDDLSQIDSDSDFSFQSKSPEKKKHQTIQNQFEESDDCVIVEESPKKYIKI